MANLNTTRLIECAVAKVSGTDATYYDTVAPPSVWDGIGAFGVFALVSMIPTPSGAESQPECELQLDLYARFQLGPVALRTIDAQVLAKLHRTEWGGATYGFRRVSGELISSVGPVAEDQWLRMTQRYTAYIMEA